ncbi:Meiosis-specific protein ASY3 [Frankliniella fusca]|uniref:Meiosis-specific protein ASY3 n=1 Tax=Frankliniella fusca TaxID=407009 RepID=A0AAE1H340_9NEOP|nr:Meiosis-specific protein ASY3 [Frankliniella fusca]
MRSIILTSLLAVLLVKSEAQQAAFNVDGIVDTLLGRAEEHILPQISLPDASVSETFKVVFVNVKASLMARKGWLSSPRTVRRFDSSKLTMKDQNTFLVDIPFGFNVMHFGYDYETTVAKIPGPRGNFTATVSATSVNMKASVTIYDDYCHAKLDSLDLTQLGDVTINATGLSVANPLYSKMLTKFAEAQRDKIQAEIAKEFDAATKWTFDCNSYLPPVVQPCSEHSGELKPLRPVANANENMFPTLRNILH